MNKYSIFSMALMGAIVLMVGGCGHSVPVSLVASKEAVSAKASAKGSLVVELASTKAYQVMSTVDDIAKLTVTVSGGGLTAPVSKDVTATDLFKSLRKGQAKFDELPAGTVTISVIAYDADGNEIGDGVNNSVLIVGGEPRTGIVVVTLHPTHKPSSKGSMGMVVDIVDGAETPKPIPSVADDPDYAPLPAQ